MSSITGPHGQLIAKRIRANVRMSEAGEVVITTRGMHGSLETVFYTRTEAKTLIEALTLALQVPMSDFPVEWGPER
jgi:hypothetical protein